MDPGFEHPYTLERARHVAGRLSCSWWRSSRGPARWPATITRSRGPIPTSARATATTRWPDQPRGQEAALTARAPARGAGVPGLEEELLDVTSADHERWRRRPQERLDRPTAKMVAGALEQGACGLQPTASCGPVPPRRVAGRGEEAGRGQPLAADLEDFLADELAQLRLTRDDLRSWRPPAPTRGRRARTAAR